MVRRGGATAVRHLGTSLRAEKFAEIDPEEFYHFGLSRPHVRFKPGSETEREITWPVTEFSLARASDLARDVIVGIAIEPHLRWKAYCGHVLDLARSCEVGLILSLGALLALAARGERKRQRLEKKRPGCPRTPLL